MEFGKIDKEVQRGFFVFVFVYISVEMKETKKILLYERVNDIKYKHLQTEDVPFLCFWQGNVIATGLAVK